MKYKPGTLRSIGIDPDGRALAGSRRDYPVKLVHGCCHRFLGEFGINGTELVYSDRPHLRSEHRSSQRYRHDYDDWDHEATLGLL